MLYRYLRCDVGMPGSISLKIITFGHRKNIHCDNSGSSTVSFYNPVRPKI